MRFSDMHQLHVSARLSDCKSTHAFYPLLFCLLPAAAPTYTTFNVHAIDKGKVAEAAAAASKARAIAALFEEKKRKEKTAQWF